METPSSNTSIAGNAVPNPQTIDNYSQLLDALGQVHTHTTYSEKRKVLTRLADFLHSEGYGLLAASIRSKATELTTKA